MVNSQVLAQRQVLENETSMSARQDDQEPSNLDGSTFDRTTEAARSYSAAPDRNLLISGHVPVLATHRVTSLQEAAQSPP
jgi:hypothetical protein